MAGARRYRGRFAPSPTGPLHAGSLVAALASYLDARAHGGEWLLRIEDIDPPREARGASEAIQKTLVAHGLRWDGEVLFQSTRIAAYQRALEILDHRGCTFPCRCTRAVLGPNGSCGQRCNVAPGDSHSMRYALAPDAAQFTDSIQGPLTLRPAHRDLVVRRRDGLFSYALAVVVDDGWQGITDVVRGMDLLDQTPAQRQMLIDLGYEVPRYGHLPLLLNDAGDKLSKQTGAAALDNRCALENLRSALAFLGQNTHVGIGSAETLLKAATAEWDLGALRARADAAPVYPAPATP